MTKEEAEIRIDNLYMQIMEDKHWLVQTSNPMKMRLRRKSIKKAQQEISELKARFQIQ